MLIIDTSQGTLGDRFKGRKNVESALRKEATVQVQYNLEENKLVREKFQG